MERQYKRALDYSARCPDFTAWEAIYRDSEWGPETSYVRIMLCEIETGVSWHGTSRL